MPKFLIERKFPGAGKLTPKELQEISRGSCSVLRDMGPDVQWLHSWVTDDRIFCVHIAPDEDHVREHARRGDFPVDQVFRIRNRIDPTTAEDIPWVATQVPTTATQHTTG